MLTRHDGTAAMSLRKPGQGLDGKGRSKSGGKFVRLGEGLLTSEAWRSLSGAAIRYYIELRRRYRGSNNGRLHLSQAEARKRLGMGSHSVQRAQAELQEKGFIVLRAAASFYHKRAAEFALTDERDDTLTGIAALPGNAWKHWRKNKSPCRNDILHDAETTSSPCRNGIASPSNDAIATSSEAVSDPHDDVISTLLLESASPGAENGSISRPRIKAEEAFLEDVSFRPARRSRGGP